MGKYQISETDNDLIGKIKENLKPSLLFDTEKISDYENEKCTLNDIFNFEKVRDVLTGLGGTDLDMDLASHEAQEYRFHAFFTFNGNAYCVSMFASFMLGSLLSYEYVQISKGNARIFREEKHYP